MSKFYRLLLVGAPGVGKGTYSVRAATALQCAAISSGDLLRKEVTNKTEIGKKLQSMIEGGVLVPDEIISGMVASHLKELKQSNQFPGGYILDGYPRNVNQAKTLWDSKEIQVDHVINLTQPRNVIVTKLSSRRCCADCGFVYNCAKINEGGIVMDPLMPKTEGVCDKCGSTKPLVTRKDDQLDVVEKRQSEYEALATPLLEFYESKRILHNFEVLGGTKVYLPKLLDLIKSL
ncbi:adenylate kinase [Angomonas deanei]|uniref:Adenylate kinase/AAA domain/Adenylate kinase, active site lid, putative n=1 Tax=Angomonas deanei TaxID=59799 RepID=A0A7G2CEY4_9TRYP|nr:adenylate kinase [Angomonas deanei]CAD2217434.1 Adenylate kinase/AAA domain/Adenylate kinase, active site lid, putative [Angomonas deanei]|eukprot:EPY42158.1 adenylate kinase [Angomonas deanei]